MRLLILGGTRFVGRAVLETALAAGHEVTAVNRGLTGAGGSVDPAVEVVRADRSRPGALAAALGDLGAGRRWDAVIDTWSGAPRAVRESARLLAGRVGHYGYVSSRSVYAWPFPLDADETAPLVDGDPGAGEVEYPAAKRGGELAVLESFDGRCLLARAGLILGPYENVGRLVWWLRRLERGGDVLAPGPPDLPLQYLDARDLAGWLLRSAEQGLTGAVNAVSGSGHATMQALLEAAIAVTGSAAHLVWLSPDDVRRAGIEPWTQLPIWLPPDGEYAGMHRGDVGRARAAGLTCRPVEQTVADTWAWMQSEGEPAPPTDRPAPGLDHALEAAVLEAHHPPTEPENDV